MNYPIHRTQTICKPVSQSRSVGVYGYEDYGIVPFMIPGYDMYRFLVSTLYYIPAKVKKQVYKLFPSHDLTRC